MPAPISKPPPPPPPRDPQYDITQAVRDTVTVRPHPERTRVARSQTAQSPSPPTKHTQRRSHSQDSSHRNDKPKSKSKSKKGSQHADVIDRLDFTGVGPMFHHDGPFDACAPSRNRQHNNKAPMLAWAPQSEDLVGSTGGAYPSVDAYKAFTTSNYVDPPKKKVDAIAEAWGIHEPEPYEEFFAGGGRADGDTPASSIYNGRDSQNTRPGNTQKRTKDSKETRDIYREYIDGVGQTTTTADPSRPRGPTRRPLVPPPQPIFVPENSDLIEPAASSPPLSPGGHPQRKKSLMHRIRKMRDAPNVPVSSDYDQPSSPSYHSDSGAQRPTHRSQNSFLGRFSGGRSGQPVNDKPEPFVYIEQTNKDLPPPPPRRDSESPPESTSAGYFDAANGGGAGASPGLGRKASLMKKVGRVVGRNRQ